MEKTFGTIKGVNGGVDLDAVSIEVWSREGKLFLQFVKTGLQFDIYYPVVLIFGSIFPLVWLRDKYEKTHPKPEPQNLCHVCGYDLRATPDRCPECGTRKPLDSMRR